VRYRIPFFLLCLACAAIGGRSRHQTEGFSVSYDSTLFADSSLVSKTPSTLSPRKTASTLKDTSALKLVSKDTVAHPREALAVVPAIAAAKHDSSAVAVKKDTLKDTLKKGTESAVHPVSAVIKDSISKINTTTLVNNSSKKITQSVAVKKPYRSPRPGLKWTVSHNIKLAVLLISLSVIIITALYFRRRSEHDRFMTTTRLSIMDKEIQRVCRYVELNYSDVELSVEKLCREMVTGQAFIEALFQRDIGMSVEDFIRQVRINRAKLILEKDPSLNITDVAERVGYIESILFYENLQKITGMSFGEYQASLLSGKKIP
jgi:AraC-like DNA-binding protein